MKTILTFLLLAISIGRLSAQPAALLITDNDPRLSPEESAWLNTHLQPEQFNFDGKCIGFVELTSGAFWGIGKMTFPERKKNLFQALANKGIYRLYPLTAAEQASTGYDALLVVAHRKLKGKLRRLEREKIVHQYYNRHPKIPVEAGKDNDPLLSPANAGFFNEIYRHYRLSSVPASFDFSGKKLAIFIADVDYKKFVRKSIPEYVARVKEELNTWGHSSSDFTYILTEEQKKEARGYDVIIVYRDKKGLPRDWVIQQLNKTGAWDSETTLR